MSLVPIPFVGQSATGRSIVFDADRTVNLFQEQADSAGAEAPVALIGTAGLSLIEILPTLPLRGSHVMNERLFVVGGPIVYEVFEDGTYHNWGGLSTLDGPVGLSDNNGYLVIGDGTQFKALDLTAATITAITDAPLGTWSTYIDGYTLFIERDTGNVFYSSPDNPLLVNGLDFFNAETNPDPVVQIVTIQSEIWVGGTQTMEVYYDSGNTDNVFQRISSGRIEQGVASPRSMRRFDNSIVWLGQDQFGSGIVWRAQGYTPTRISTHAVEYAVAQEPDLSQITAIVWQDAGHTFYQINLPAAGTSWVYDAATREWHERAWWNTATGKYERHRAELHEFAFGKHIVADYATGAIYEQRLDLYSDAGNPLRAMRRVGNPSSGLQRISCASVQVDMETGLAGVDNPTMQLRVSYDGGRNWGNERSVSIGKIGETHTRAIFHRLGSGRDWAMEFSISDAVPRRLFGAQARVSVGTS